MHYWCSHCSDRKVATHFQAEVVSLQAEFLNIVLDESGKKGVELAVPTLLLSALSELVLVQKITTSTVETTVI